MTARITDPDTSHEAAQLPRRNGQEVALLAHYHRIRRGLTDFELAEFTDTIQTSIGKRRHELMLAGYIEGTDLRRPSPSGSPAKVWRITPEGIDAARTLLGRHR